MMMRGLAKVFIHGVVIGFLCCVGARAAATTPAVDAPRASDDSATQSFKPDREFVLAVFRNDRTAVGRLLDDDFTWTDAQGRTLTKAQTLENLPALALGDENQVNEKEQANRLIAIHRAERGNVYVLRVWVKRPKGWRALVYQEVSQQKAPPANESSAQDCENPCKTVPFTPKDDDERGVIKAYQQVERAVMAHDSAAWGAVIADDFFAVTSNSDHPLDKKMRMVGLDQQKQGGIAAFPLVSARMFKFGETMIMTSLQQPTQDKPLHVTRVWNKQQGKWLETLSYQTTIQ
jgi:ketosteroid isomerase-like protein